MEAEIMPEWEPTLLTDPELADVLAELVAREPIFHRSELGTRTADFDRMMAENFWEVGASGRRYGRDHVLKELESRHSVAHFDIWETMKFYCRRLADDVYLLTYTLVQNQERRTRRMTVWQRTLEGWKIVFHQGTIIQSDITVQAADG